MLLHDSLCWFHLDPHEIHIDLAARLEVVAGRGRVGKSGRQRKGGQTLDEDCLEVCSGVGGTKVE